MTEFLIALMALVSSVMQTGKPAELPPHTQEEFSAIGQQVAELAKSLNSEASESEEDETGSTNPESTNSGELESVNDGADDTINSEEENESENKPEHTQKVPAYNVKSGKMMPVHLPKAAVENSQALEEVTDESEETGGADPVAQDNSSQSDNSDNGQEIADSQPEAGQSNGQAFGKSVSETAKNNSNRP